MNLGFWDAKERDSTLLIEEPDARRRVAIKEYHIGLVGKRFPTNFSPSWLKHSIISSLFFWAWVMPDVDTSL